MGWSLRQLNLEKVLKITVLFEMLFWSISAVITVLSYYREKNDQNIYSEIKTRAESRGGDGDAEYAKFQRKIALVTNWLAPTAGILFFVQLFLYFGTTRKNRCLIFTWIVLSIAFGIIRCIIIIKYSDSLFLLITVWLYIVRLPLFYFAARFMVQITNERRGQEEVEAPHFRPQSDDPREYREGVNYPSYPRSLQFADRVAGAYKEEHAHPKRWTPTYDAIDDDGRMVVVVDDPVYESL